MCTCDGYDTEWQNRRLCDYKMHYIYMQSIYSALLANGRFMLLAICIIGSPTRKRRFVMDTHRYTH